MVDLIIFDLDGTLIDRDSEQLLPNVANWFIQNKGRFDYAIATNQGGVGLRHWMEQESFGKPQNYPNEQQALKHVQSAIYQLNDVTAVGFDVYMSFAYQSKQSKQWSPIPLSAMNSNQTKIVDARWLPDWRKPAPGMLIEAMLNYNVDAQDTLMVGDSDDDRMAALNAGVNFCLASDFFAPTKA